MLSKREYETLQKQLSECNCTYEENNLCQMRSSAMGLAHSQFLRNAGTKDLILYDVSAIAKDHPNDRFHVRFDGISKFTILCNDRILIDSNYYEVESLYQIKHDEFKKKVTRALSEFEAL